MFGLGVPEFLMIILICLPFYFLHRRGKKILPDSHFQREKINNINEIKGNPILIDCPLCKSQISNQAPVCPRCGHPISAPTSTVSLMPKKNRSLTIFLALILGGIGAHKFYLDKPGTGIFYLLFVWTFIPSIIGLLEAIQYLGMKEDVFQQKYLEKKL